MSLEQEVQSMLAISNYRFGKQLDMTAYQATHKLDSD